MPQTVRTIMIVAGEASGDAHAARLVEEARNLAGDVELRFFGAAGPKMRAAGVEAVVESDRLAIVGVPEIARALPMFIRAFRALMSAARKQRPDVVVLVDFPEFNLKLARPLKRMGLRVVYYISPQLWAWRKYRARTVRKHVDLLLSILPFERDWYSGYGIGNVEYVGNPLVNSVRPALDRGGFRSRHGIDPGVPMIALLPGSRGTEISRHLPIMLESAAIILRSRPDARFLIALPEGREVAIVDEQLSVMGKIGETLRSSVRAAVGETYDALNACDAAAVCSGTATMEAGMIGAPMVIVYKGSALNHALLMPLIDVEHFGLVNLIAGKRVAQELIQDTLTPDALAAEIEKLLDPKNNSAMRSALSEASAKLGSGGASRRAAEAVLRVAAADQSRS